MLAETKKKSALEWLQLTPELLSGLPARALARCATPATLPTGPAVLEQTSCVASINPATVSASPTGLSFYPYPATGRAYASLETGGTQQAARAEMTGYLATRLLPNPAE